MECTGQSYKAIIVAETDKIMNLTLRAVSRLGSKVKSVRAVKAAASRFGDRIAANPSPLRVETLEVVGFCAPKRGKPWEVEPIVLQEGKPQPVSHTFLIVAGEYWVGTSAQIDSERVKIVGPFARKIATELFLCEAMFELIHLADPDCTLSAMSCDPKKLTVELTGDDDGRIARRLPKWLKVGRDGTEPDTD